MGTPSCGLTFAFDKATGTCVPKTVQPVCPAGYERDSSNQCVSAGAAPKPDCSEYKPPDDPFYDPNVSAPYKYDEAQQACVPQGGGGGMGCRGC